MGVMRCIAIGISDAPPLEFLQGAVNGAKSFGAWASKAGIPTEVLTDEKQPIGLDNVKAAFERIFAGKPKISRLLVYFAGHGVARDASEDLWLLSQWYTAQRGVGINGLIRKFARYGIEQVCVVSDACRSPAATEDSADLVADPILDRGPFDPTSPLVDLMRASSPFHAAYMVRGATDEEDRCIFSAVLCETLSGAHDAAFEAAEPARISNYSLANFLQTEVPLRAGQYQVTLRPEIATGFRPPDNIYVASRPAPPPVLKPWPAAGAVGAMSSGASGAAGRRGWSTASTETRAGGSLELEMFATRESPRGIFPKGLARSPKDLFESDFRRLQMAERRQKEKIKSILDNYASREVRPTHFESGSGFSVSGAEVARASSRRQVIAERDQVPSWWRLSTKGHGGLAAPAPLLIEFENGNWGGAAALPNHVATFTVEAEEVVSVIYRPVFSLPEDSRDTEIAVAQLRTGVLSAEAGYDLAARLRDEKERDPVRGVLAAYIYEALGDVDGIRRVALYLTNAGVPIPYDVALLGRLRASRSTDGSVMVQIPGTGARTPRSPAEANRNWTFVATPPGHAQVAGAFPWLRQGWLLLEDEDPSDLVMDGLAQLRTELLGSPFTTLTADGGAKLAKMIEEA